MNASGAREDSFQTGFFAFVPLSAHMLKVNGLRWLGTRIRPAGSKNLFGSFKSFVRLFKILSHLNAIKALLL